MADNINKPDDEPNKLDRRGALKIIATTAAVVPVFGCTANLSNNVNQTVANQQAATQQNKLSKSTGPSGSLSDPDLLNPEIHWDFVLTEPELKQLKVLANIIIPKDEISPGAGDLNAQDFINEWVSAPYKNNKGDLIIVRGGLVWLNSESKKRYQLDFISLDNSQTSAILNDIKWEKKAAPQYKSAARFFSKVRDLTATAFYTTEEGMADIGYMGNKPLARFDGPTLAVLKQLGLEKYAQ